MDKRDLHEINMQRLFGFLGVAIGAAYGAYFGPPGWLMAIAAAILAAIAALKTLRPTPAHDNGEGAE